MKANLIRQVPRIAAERAIYYLFLLSLKTKYLFLGIEGVNAFIAHCHSGVQGYLRAFGAQIGERAIIPGPLLIINAKERYDNLHVGRHVHIGKGVLLDLTDEIHVGSESVIAAGTMVFTHQSAGDRPISKIVPDHRAPMSIGANSYIGARSLILCGSHVGEGSVVGAGSVVLNNVAPHTMVAGVPAAVKKVNLE